MSAEERSCKFALQWTRMVARLLYGVEDWHTATMVKIAEAQGRKAMTTSEWSTAIEVEAERAANGDVLAIDAADLEESGPTEEEVWRQREARQRQHKLAEARRTKCGDSRTFAAVAASKEWRANWSLPMQLRAEELSTYVRPLNAEETPIYHAALPVGFHALPDAFAQTLSTSPIASPPSRGPSQMNQDTEQLFTELFIPKPQPWPLQGAPQTVGGKPRANQRADERAEMHAPDGGQMHAPLAARRSSTEPALLMTTLMMTRRLCRTTREGEVEDIKGLKGQRARAPPQQDNVGVEEGAEEQVDSVEAERTRAVSKDDRAEDEEK